MSIENSSQLGSSRARAGGAAVLALFSSVVLAFEVFLTKLLSYSLFVLLIYVVLGVAMLGFGAAGSLVSLRSRWLSPERSGTVLCWATLGFVAALFGSLGVFVRLSRALLEATALTFTAAFLLSLPFLAGGVVITVALSRPGSAIGRTYAANLIGSGLGCLLMAIALRPLGGERFVALLGLLAWLCALGYARELGRARSGALSLALVAGLALCAVGFAWPAVLLPIQPEPRPSGQVDKINRYADEHGIESHKVYDRWNATGRIQIFRYERAAWGPQELPEGDGRRSLGPYPFMFYAQDSSNGSFLLQWDGRDGEHEGPAAEQAASPVSRMCRQTMFALGHYHPRPRVLVIGLGGGPDVQCALYHGASSIDVAEINPDSIAAVTGPFDRWLGGIGSDRRVRYHVYDGRSFAHAARGRGYDLVQLSGVDTKAALASGSLALSENQLYTQEAFVDYLSSLSDRGVLAILRFEEWEALRLANTAADALRTLGVTRPDRHVAIVRNGPLFGVLVQRSPFTLDDSQALYARFPAADPAFRGVFIWFYEIFDYPLRKRPEVVHTPFAPAQGPIGGYFAALATGREAQFIQKYPLQISATHDDRPFFFDVMRYDQPQTWQAPHMRLLRNMLGTVSFLSIALILLPVWRMRMRKTAELLRALGFFGTIGLGYLLIEVWLLHRFGMFLGHQTRALVVVLSGLLVSSGVGASVGERLWPEPRGRVLRAMLAIAAWLVLGAFALPGLFDTELAASLVGRVLLTLAFVLPLGFAMGMPFPAGLRWARGVDALSVPWCVGVNAFSSVLATVAVVPMAMVWGYAAVALAGTVLYGLAALLALSWQSAASTPS